MAQHVAKIRDQHVFDLPGRFHYQVRFLRKRRADQQGKIKLTISDALN